MPTGIGHYRSDWMIRSIASSQDGRARENDNTFYASEQWLPT